MTWPPLTPSGMGCHAIREVSGRAGSIGARADVLA